MSKNLDEIDLKILAEIQADGRITNVELAKRVGISPPPCLRRVRTLEEEGYILGYRGLLDPRRLGFDVTVFASVHLSSQADADLRAFEDFVRAEPLVRECWMLSGEVDFILKCVAPDMATFQDFVTHLTAAPHVRNVRTSLVLHNSKYEPAVPLDVKVAGRGHRAIPVIARRSRRSNPFLLLRRNGLLRFARNDEVGFQLTSSASHRRCTARRRRSPDRGRRSRTGLQPYRH